MGIKHFGVLAAYLLATSAASAQQVCSLDWTLTETLRIGSIDGEDALSTVLDIAIGPDGEIYVVQAFVPSVFVFSPGGELLRTIGREGSGPGDFEAGPRSVEWVDGLLWVADRLRTQSFTPEGEPRDFVTFATYVAEEGSTFRPEVPLPGGGYWARRSVRAVPDPSADLMVTLRRFGADGSVLDTLAVLDARHSRIVVSDRGGFTMHPLYGSLPGGDTGGLRRLLSGDRASIVLLGEVREDDPNPSFDLLRIGLEGDTLLRRSVPYRPRRVSRGERNWWFDQFAAFVAGDSTQGRPNFRRTSEGQRARERATARDLFWLPETYPPVREILAGSDDTIWVLREFDVLEPSADWEVYDEAGELIGRLNDAGQARFVPWYPRLRILQASRDEVWATTTDGFDVPYIHRFDVDRGCS